MTGSVAGTITHWIQGINLIHNSAQEHHLILDRPASMYMISCRVIMPMTFSAFTTGSRLTPNSAINFNARSRESFAPNEYNGRPVSSKDDTRLSATALMLEVISLRDSVSVADVSPSALVAFRNASALLYLSKIHLSISVVLSIPTKTPSSFNTGAPEISCSMSFSQHSRTWSDDFNEMTFTFITFWTLM